MLLQLFVGICFRRFQIANKLQSKIYSLAGEPLSFFPFYFALIKAQIKWYNTVCANMPFFWIETGFCSCGAVVKNQTAGKMGHTHCSLAFHPKCSAGFRSGELGPKELLISFVGWALWTAALSCQNQIITLRWECSIIGVPTGNLHTAGCHLMPLQNLKRDCFF